MRSRPVTRGPRNTKRNEKKEVMADDLDALLAELDGVEMKPAQQIRRVKDRVTTRRRKAVRNVKKINHNAETKSTKTLERVPTTDMEKLMSSIEDFGAIMAQRQEVQEEEEDEWIAEDDDYEEGYREDSDLSEGGPVMVEEESDSDDEPPEIVMVDEKEPAPAAAAAVASAVSSAADTDAVERNLGMEATTEDFDNSEPLGWECNVEVGQMVIVERSNGTYKYGLVSNFEDDDDGLAVVEFLVDIRNGERVIKRWDVEERPFDVRVVRDGDMEDDVEEDDNVLSVDQLDPEDEKLVKELFAAARSGAWREIQQFCNAEPDFSLDIRDKEGYTAVAVSAFYGHVYAVEIFLENGADPNLGDADRCTPLHCAAQEGFTETVSTLLRFKADVNIAMKASGRTPLFLASQEGYTKVVELLLNAKARTDMDNKGCTALFISVQESHNDITQLLLKAKADPDNPSRLGTPPLLMAVQKEDLPCVRMLLESGANVNAATPSGITALSKAMLLEYVPIVRLLKSHGAIMDPVSGEKTLKEVAKRVSSNVANVDWNDTARTAIGHKRAGARKSAYGMLTRTK